MRTPLHELPEAEREARLREMGLGPDMLPLIQSQLEQAANQRIKEEPMPDTNQSALAAAQAAAGKLLAPVHVPAWLVTLAHGAAGVLGILAMMPALPAWARAGAAILALVCAFLAGLPFGTFSAAHPLVPLTLVPVLLAASGWLATAAAHLPPGSLLQGLVGLAAVICMYLAGHATPSAVALPPKA